ncbi:MAG: hypothetical protein ACI9IA_000941 [Enterobacterales bacterium]|jgi:hypothetical protein
MKLYILMSTFMTAIIFSNTLLAAKNANEETGEFLMEYKFMVAKDSDGKLIHPHLALSCAIDFNDIVDARRNKQTIGRSHLTPLLAGGVDPWLDQVVSSINEKFPIKASKKITIKAELIRLYTYFQGSNINGIAAVKFNYYQDETLIGSKNIRGFSSRSDLFASTEGHNTTVNTAMSDAIYQLLTDVHKICE